MHLITCIAMETKMSKEGLNILTELIGELFVMMKILILQLPMFFANPLIHYMVLLATQMLEICRIAEA